MLLWIHLVSVVELHQALLNMPIKSTPQTEVFPAEFAETVPLEHTISGQS